jgi:monoterpene epsilon-lactone hydrolase
MTGPIVPVVRTALRLLVKPVLRPQVPLSVQRAWLEALAPVTALPAGTTVEATTVGARAAERLVPPGAAPHAAVLLLHGGGFLTCSPRTHRAFAARLAAAAGVAVTVPDYRLAPEHPYPAPVADAQAAYDELAPHGPVAVVGDSAGGTLALLLPQRLRDHGAQVPVALGLVSPLVDLTLALSDSYCGPDPYLNREWGYQGRDAFVGAADPRGLSPLHPDLSGLPPLQVHVGEHERLRPEGVELVERVRAAGGSAELVLLPGLWHDAHLQAHLIAVAATATDELGRWLATHLLSGR